MSADLHHWLKAFLLPRTQCQASEFLALAHSSSQYLALFQHYFPVECAQSLAHPCRQWLLPLPGNAYTRYEWQFLRLVSTRLFPIPDYVFDDPFEESRCFEVPIEPLGLSSIYEDAGVCDMELGWQLLLYLCGQLPAAFFDGRFDAATAGIFARAIEHGRMSETVLRAHCAEREEPLVFLPLAMALLDHDTGTVWLDVTYDLPINDAFWDRETLDALVAQWREAEDIWNKAMQVLHWLEADVLSHFTEVIDLWNLSLRESRLSLSQEPEQTGSTMLR